MGRRSVRVQTPQPRIEEQTMTSADRFEMIQDPLAPNGCRRCYSVAHAPSPAASQVAGPSSASHGAIRSRET